MASIRKPKRGFKKTVIRSLVAQDLKRSRKLGKGHARSKRKILNLALKGQL